MNLMCAYLQCKIQEKERGEPVVMEERRCGCKPLEDCLLLTLTLCLFSTEHNLGHSMCKFPYSILIVYYSNLIL